MLMEGALMGLSMTHFQFQLSGKTAVAARHPDFALATARIQQSSLWSIRSARQLPFGNFGWARVDLVHPERDRDKRHFRSEPHRHARAGDTLRHRGARKLGADLRIRGSRKVAGSPISANAFEMLGVQAAVGSTAAIRWLAGSQRTVVRRTVCGKGALGAIAPSWDGRSAEWRCLYCRRDLPSTSFPADAGKAVPLISETDPRRGTRIELSRVFAHFKDGLHRPGARRVEMQSQRDQINIRRRMQTHQSRTAVARRIVGNYKNPVMTLLGAWALSC